MRKYFILFLFFYVLSLWADNASNVRVHQDGKNIIITYDLSKASNVSVYVKSKESPNWYKLQQVTGDIGRNIVLGTNKQVVWSPLDEFDSFVGSNVQFKIEAGNFENGHEYVDLGLSVKWATCNVGAENPEDYGDYFAWGEVESKKQYDWGTYKYCAGSMNTITKYSNNGSSGNNGLMDNKTILDSVDDVATIKWGGLWRMPTDAEMTELLEKCTLKWITQNGVDGCKVIGINGNSIFLPAAGCMNGILFYNVGSWGHYRSKSLGPYPYYCCTLIVRSDFMHMLHCGSLRFGGASVRPVCQ